jgi:hypothetical protein
LGSRLFLHKSKPPSMRGSGEADSGLTPLKTGTQYTTTPTGNVGVVQRVRFSEHGTTIPVRLADRFLVALLLIAIDPNDRELPTTLLRPWP